MHIIVPALRLSNFWLFDFHVHRNVKLYMADMYMLYALSEQVWTLTSMCIHVCFCTYMFEYCVYWNSVSSNVDHQFEPYPCANTVAPSWCSLGCRSRILMVKYINPRFYIRVCTCFIYCIYLAVYMIYLSVHVAAVHLGSHQEYGICCVI
jgi:hypothetical protein